MIYIEKATNFEFYSSTSKGAVQGYGYELHKGEMSMDVYKSHCPTLTDRSWCSWGVWASHNAPHPSARLLDPRHSSCRW